MKPFYAAVYEMHYLQRKYFRTRDAGVLVEAKAAEKRVDALLKEEESRQQGSLDEGLRGDGHD